MASSLVLAGMAGAQQPRQARAPHGRPWLLGVLLWHDSPNDLEALRGLRAGLRARGHPFELLERHAREDVAAGRRHLAELRAAGVDLIFALGTRAALLAAEHVKDRPVVFTAVTHPVFSGVVSDWRGSGRNVAGNSNWIAPGAMVEVFRKAVPGLVRLGVLRSRRAGVVSAAEVRAMREFLASSEAPQVELVERVADDEAGLADAATELAAARVQAIWIPIDYFVYRRLAVVRRALREFRIPLVTSAVEGARSGAVAAVVADYELLGRRAVVVACEILDRGRPPGVIPIGRLRSHLGRVRHGSAREVRSGRSWAEAGHGARPGSA